MPITEVFLGAFLQVLFDRLASAELLNFAQREGIDRLLKKWEMMLESIKNVLDDAEDKQLTDHSGVKPWLENLRDLAYDIEDLFDEFAIEFAESKSKTELSTSKACSLLSSFCFKMSSREFKFDHQRRSKIEKIDGRLKDIITQKDNLSLKEHKGKQSATHSQDKLFPTTHLIEDCFVGRKDEKMEILKLITEEEDDRTCADIKVISIVGMSGVGKTALAQQAFNDARVTSYFDAKAWVCVSYHFDMLAITKSILQKINCTLSCEDKDLDWLQDKLKKNLSRKKFLIVLDNVWNTNYEKWTTLLKPFQLGAKGSKFIITTCDSRAAEIVGARHYTLTKLSRETCVTLLSNHAFGVINFNHHPHLAALGLQIVEKCQGLPLAVKTLAGLLRTKASPSEWEVILTSKIWDLLEEGNDILPALKLSYLHLPSHLRRCFAYCAIFPKDYEIQRDELICWWIAEGLVQEKKGKDRWNAGLNYFNELVCRSLFQNSSGSESRFLMHDLVNNLAKIVAGATHFSSGELSFEWDNNPSLARHASFIPSGHVVPGKLRIYHGMKGLRSFISLRKQSSHHSWSFLSQNVLNDLLSALKYLRVLSLSHYNIEEIPDCIGKLRHLRHLNLSYTCINMLPKSIVALYNLEALMLRGCEYLLELPNAIEKLINLRFLDIRDTGSLETMPLYIGNLVGLEMLSKFIVGTENGSRLKELKNLENLEGELCIFDLHKVREAEDAVYANLCMKKGICRLTLQWSRDLENFRNEELEEKVLSFLCPHQNLKNLTISYYGGLKFPSWLGSPSHDNIVHLCLRGCQRVKALPSLGQLPSLKELYIEDLNAICTIGYEFYGKNSPFPSLVTLEFKGMPLWKDWSHYVDTEEVGVMFPCLKHLVICRCPMLIGRLPSQLSSLIKLQIYYCPQMDDVSSITSLPSLNELDFVNCNEGVLKSLVNRASLTTLVIGEVDELTCLNHEFTSSLNKLKKLKIQRCTNLIYLWQDKDIIRNLDCLKSLVIKNCPKFIYFVAEGDIELPGNLETIKLINCVNVRKLPSKMHTLTSLRGLYINGCNMLQSLPKELGIHLDEPSTSASSNTHSDMISSLQDLRIFKCNSLPASLFSEGRFLAMALKRLHIRDCKGVESLAEINLNSLQSLQEIIIWDCENLRSLPQGLHMLSQLTSLELINCPALELECFPPLPFGISKFSLWGCPKIKSLSNQLYRLTCLHHLEIRRCESINCFPDLPPRLQTLALCKCGNIKQPAMEWLIPLTSLERLVIDSSIGVGEEKDLLLPLPHSLLHLHIYGMGKVERLSSSLPPSLRNLWIFDCPKLRELPQDGLPPSLEELWIHECGILEERCRKGTGCYWPLICEIPCVRLGW